MDTGLKFSVTYRDHDLIKAHVSLSNGSFSGETDLYIGSGELGDLATQLQGFPRNTSDERSIVLGSLDPDSAGGGVSMRFYCADLSGHVRVDARMESDKDSTIDRQSVRLVVPIEPAELDSFVEQLRILNEGMSDVATLSAAIRVYE